MHGPRARRALVALGIVGAGVALVALGPPLCPTAFFLGFPCPGCGLTRATLALLRGDVGWAFHLHPLVFVLSPLFAYALGTSLVDYVRGGRSNVASLLTQRFSARARYSAAAALLVVALGVWGARFAGYFGGPVPVESFRSLATRMNGAR